MTMVFKDWNIEEMTGYVPKTTFYMDFSIAEAFGENAIMDTFKRAFKEWKSNVQYVTELSMALNWKCWEHYGCGNNKFAVLYDKLWKQTDGWCCGNLKGDDLKYYYKTTD